jgi:serine/threonine protein phosphatase PrpC
MSACPSCQNETKPSANFCGKCGTRLKALTTTPVAVCRCGAGPESIDTAGFCNECGVRVVDADPRSHEELVVDASFGGVTDRGRRHASNEDAIGLAEGPSPLGPVRVLIVCDGVSTSSAAAQASTAAVAAFRDAALASLRADPDLSRAALLAADAAQRAVVAIPFQEGQNAPATTLVAALVRDRAAVIAWAGDSRAYQIDDDPKQLTKDDSWLNHVVDRGELTAEQARKHKYAHAIVNSLGNFADGDVVMPNICEIMLPAASRLLLCSDGLWNYADDIQKMAQLVPAVDALDACRELVAFANKEGGHDNISAIILAIE